MDYEEAARIIERHGHKVRGGTGIVSTHNPTAKRLKNQTWLTYDRDGHYTLAYFNKQIIEFHPKYMVFNDHDYFSSSTMQRFNEYTPRGFHVSGCTYSAFKLQRPLGFITTPKGTFPYAMPCSFTYEGDPFDHGGLYADARAILLKVPHYVNAYLDELFSGAPSVIADEATTRRAFESQIISSAADEVEAYRISRLMGASIEQQSTYRHLAVLAAEHENGRPISDRSVGGMELTHVLRLLIRYGTAVFSTRSLAGRMETTLVAGKIPNINRQQLRKAIRQVTIEHIVNLLGFDVVQWNRRER